jgi:hypothetical protein
MRISDLARRAGATAKTVRFYEKSGLLAEPGRTAGGYRDYPAEAVAHLRFIRAAATDPAKCHGDRVCSILDTTPHKPVPLRAPFATRLT